MSKNISGAQEGRQRLSFDFDDDTELLDKEEVKRKIEDISEKAGFVSRAPKKREIDAQTQVSNTENAVRQRGFRARTGRTFSFGTKLREETYLKICALSDKASEDERRPVTIAEILERSIELLEKKMLSET